jgi:predicted  nucleic acid-binding Zn-ribbon protein
VDTRIVIDVLVELADCEHELTEIKSAADREADASRRRRELSAEYAEDATSAGAGSAAAAAGFRARDRELRAAEARLADRRSRLVGVSDRRQHQALTREIADLEQRIAALEAEAIALLDEAADQRRTADEARRQEEDLRGQEREREPALSAAQERAKLAGGEIQAQIARLVGMLPPDVASRVTRLRRRDGHAVAWLADGVCTGCYAQLPAQKAIAAEAGRQLVICPSCARYVVHRPWR